MAKIKAQALAENCLKMVGAPYDSPGNTKMEIIVAGVNCLKMAGAPQDTPYNTKMEIILAGGGVDCSGLLIAAGANVPHGSNSLWRKYLTEKGSISDHKSSNKYPKDLNPRKSSQLEIGMAVFKWNPNTPPKFKDGLGDYQHVGVVTGVNPLRITHASTDTDCVTTDKSIGKFCAWGYIKGVDYSKDAPTEKQEEEQTMFYADGILKTRNGMNVRKGPGTGYARIGGIKAGMTTEFMGDRDSDWVEIPLEEGGTGWMCLRQGKNIYADIVEWYQNDTPEQDDEPEERWPDDDDDNDDDGSMNTDMNLDDLKDLRATVDELCEGSVVTGSQITAICRILRNAGFDISGVPGMMLPEDIR